MGDINQDLEVNIIDVVALIDFILETLTPSDYEFIASDINEDERLDILDVIALVNIILQN